MDAIFGAKMRVGYTRTKVCEECNGKKSRPGYTPVNCK